MNLNILINLTLISFSIAAIIVVIVKSRMHRRKQEMLHRQFLEAEDAANSVRKKEIDPELYITPDLSQLPSISEDDPHKVLRTSKRPMIYFQTPKTNLELKQEYGPAQMDILAQHEENFNEYLKALTAWATSLADRGEDTDALLILGYAIAHGAEFRNTYKLAADIYAKNGDKQTLEALLNTTETNFFKDPAVRRHIMEHITKRLEEIN